MPGTVMSLIICRANTGKRQLRFKHQLISLNFSLKELSTIRFMVQLERRLGYRRQTISGLNIKLILLSAQV